MMFGRPLLSPRYATNASGTKAHGVLFGALQLSRNSPQLQFETGVHAGALHLGTFGRLAKTNQNVEICRKQVCNNGRRTKGERTSDVEAHAQTNLGWR